MVNFLRVAVLKVELRNDTFTGYIGTVTLENLRISFSINKDLAWSTNSATIRVWNLSADHRNLIKDYGDKVTLYAGYSGRVDTSPGSNQIIFIGDTTNVRHIFDQPDIMTVMECGDGERFVNQKLVKISFIGSTPVRTVVEEIARQMKINIGEFAATPNTPYENGYVFSGMGKDALQEVCARLQLQWSVQNESLRIIPVSGYLSQQPFQVNVDTGMIGVPERYTYRRLLLPSIDPNSKLRVKAGWRVRNTLRQDILPGSKIILRSSNIRLDPAPFRVEMIRHDGDTYGPLWMSNMEVTEI